jgi:hypothetical protein
MNCDKQHDFPYSQHYRTRVDKVREMAKEIAALSLLDIDGSVELTLYIGVIDVHWFADHVGCTLVTRNEHGEILT